MSAHEEIPTQPDRVPGWAIQYLIIGTVVTILACAFVVWWFLPSDLSGGGRSDVVDVRTLPPATPFEEQSPVELERDARRVQLTRWGWADRAHQIVLLPVDLAIDRYVQAHQARRPQ